MYKQIIIKNIGNKIRFKRQETGMTIQKLAELSEITITTISNIELSNTVPTLYNLDKICKALNLSLKEVMF